MPLTRANGAMKKQLSLFLDLREWLKLRDHAARVHKPMTRIVCDWLKPHFDNLPEPGSADREGP